MADERVRALSHAARARAVLKYFGELCIALAALTLAPLAAAVLAGEHFLVPSLAGAVGLLAGLGFALGRLRAPSALQANEALVVSVLVFVMAPLVMVIPLAACGIPPLDALFEAISAVTTTGLSTLATVEDKPATFLFARAWMQWYGGLGIVVLSLALLVGPDIAWRRLGTASTSADDLATSMRVFARRMLGVYLLLSVAGVGWLLAAGVGPFRALLYTLAAVSTGGFSPSDASIAELARLQQSLVIALCVAGAISLPLYARLRREGLKALWQDVELRALLACGAAASLVVGVFHALHAGGPSGELARQASLLAFSAQTTAGFTPLDVDALDPASKLVVMASMAVGGSVGSTAGGAKLLRLLIAFRVLQWMIQRTRLPARAVADPELRRQRLVPEEVQRALMVIALFFAATSLSWLAFLAAGERPLDSLFEVVSALGTVGLSSGISRPELHAALKGVLCLDMLLGRLEIVPVLVVLAPRTWLGRKAD